MKRLIAHVSGNINGVGYSSIVATLAGTLDLEGYIEILAEGKAFIIAEGSKEDLEKFVEAIRIDNAKIGVKEILIDYREPTGEFNNFHEILGRQEARRNPEKNALETMRFNFLQTPDDMERQDREICTPDHRLKRAWPDLEQQKDVIEPACEEKLVPERCESLSRVQEKLSLNK